MRLEGVVHTEGPRNSIGERNSPSRGLQMQYLYNQREVQQKALPLRNGGRSFEEAQAKMEMSIVIGVVT